MLKFFKKIKPNRDVRLSGFTLILLFALIWASVLSLRFLITSITKALEDPSPGPEDVLHFDTEGFKRLEL